MPENAGGLASALSRLELDRDGAGATSPCEEQTRPWRAVQSPSFNRPLLRIWDNVTASKPKRHGDTRGYMLSRAPEMQLLDRESRIESLRLHGNYRDREPTPYISFTDSAERIQDLVAKRKARRRRRRGKKYLTAIDPDVRLRSGLPIVHAHSERSYYGISDPYGKDGQYYKDESLCLWYVRPAEVIGHWKWEDLIQTKDWYEQIVLPAYRHSRLSQAANVQALRNAVLDMTRVVPGEEALDGLMAELNRLAGKWLQRWELGRSKTRLIVPATFSSFDSLVVEDETPISDDDDDEVPSLKDDDEESPVSDADSPILDVDSLPYDNEPHLFDDDGD